MGGKTKQRTKNNVRPSSSGRSAELLSNNLKLEGAGAGSALPVLFPSLSGAGVGGGADALDPTLSPQFALCFKKLNKKDPITKTKALLELSELAGSSEVEDVVAALPAWARFYCALAAHTDRRVREAAQTCHGAMVSASGRRAAPHLRQLVPAWLCSQYDDHAPAQSKAQHSLTSTFPESKLPDVLWFCREEVLAHLRDSLVGGAETGVVDKNKESAEDAAAASARLAASALQGLQYVVQRLPEREREREGAAEGGDAWLRAHLAPVLRAPAFWKLAAHADPVVRAAWYAALGCAVARLGVSVLDERLGQRAVRLLVNARELDALPAASLWGCLLQFMHRVPDWYKWLDNKDLLRKRILNVLETGGWGDARRLADLLLPLLAHLPPDVRTPDFYEAFFVAAFAGLEQKSVMSSKSERQAWVTSVAECVRYVSVEREVGVVGGALRRWLAAALVPRAAPLRAHLLRHSAAAMAHLVKYWLQQAAADRPTAHFDQLVRNFWQTVGCTVLAQVDAAPADPLHVSALVEGHVLLLHALKAGILHDTRRQHPIKFEDDPPAERRDDVDAAAARPCEPHVLDRYMHNLDEVAEKMCSRYLEFARDKRVCGEVVAPLVGVVREFEPARLVGAVARRLGAGSPLGLYECVLRGWLVAGGDGAMRCQPVVDLVFLLMEHLTEHEQDAVFESFEQFPVEAGLWCVQACVSRGVRARPAARRWLRGGAASSLLALLARRAPDDAPARDLLLLCLAHGDTDDMLMSEETLCTVVSAASERVPAGAGAEGAGAEARGSFAAQLAGALAAAPGALTLAPTLDAYADLMLNLFRLNLTHHCEGGAVSAGTWREARAGWQHALAALPPARAARARAQAAALMQQRLFDSMDKLDIVKIEHIAALCPYLLRRCEGSQPPDVPEVAELTSLLLDLQPPGEASGPPVELCALRYDCIASNLNCPFDDDNEHIKQIVLEASDDDMKELTKETLMVHVYKLLFRGAYLRTVVVRGAGEEGAEARGGWGAALLAEGGLVREVCALLHDYCVLCALHDGYAFWPHYEIVQQTKRKLDSILEDIIHVSSATARRAVVSALSASAATAGYYWACARRYYEAKTLSEREREGDGEEGDGEEGDEPWEGAQLQDVVTGNGYFHSLQANLKWCIDTEAALRTKYLVMVRSVYCAHAHESRDAGEQFAPEQFARDALAGRRECSLDVIVNAYYRHNHIMLYDTDVHSASWRHVVSNAAVCEFVSSAVAARGWDLSPYHWDFATIAMCSLLTSLEGAKQHWGTTKVALLMRSVMKLYVSVAQFVSWLPAECVRRAPAVHVGALLDEWRDMFAPDSHRNIYSVLMHVFECASRCEMTSGRAGAAAALAVGAPLAPWEQVPAAARAGPLALRLVAAAACAALRPPAHHGYMYLAHAVLVALAEPLVIEDAEKLCAWSEAINSNEEERPAPAPAPSPAAARPALALSYYQPALHHLQELAHAALQDFRAGEETCETEPASDSHGVVLGYLLLSDALHHMYRLQQTDLMHQYIEMFREQKYAELLLTASLRLLPAGVAAAAGVGVGDGGGGQHAAATRDQQDMFLATKQFDVYEGPGGAVGALACRGVWHALAGWGRCGARAWAGAAPVRAARALQRLVRLYVAPPLVREQLQRVHDRASELDDTEITVYWSAGEVVCVYTVEERPLQLTVCLARDHPLSAPAVGAPPAHAAAPTPARATHWIALYLTYQNGSVLNALKMWTGAVCARVGSSPQCYICYCRLQPNTGRLPAVPCHQCNNKFHTECLRKWFSTSNKSNCPLCRGNF